MVILVSTASLFECVTWRGGRVVDGSGLENRHTRKGIGGSNPSLSAIAFVTWHFHARDTGIRKESPTGACPLFTPIAKRITRSCRRLYAGLPTPDRRPAISAFRHEFLLVLPEGVRPSSP